MRPNATRNDYLLFWLKICLLLLLLSAAVVQTLRGAAPGRSKSSSGAAEPPLPHRFTENLGQWHPHIRFQAELPRGRMYLEHQRFTFLFWEDAPILRHGHKHEAHDHEGHEHEHLHDPLTAMRPVSDVPAQTADDPRTFGAHAYRVQFVDAHPRPELLPTGASPDYSNYFLGEGRQASFVRSYQQVRYRQLYPGIDMEVYTRAGQIKYDFIVRAGSDPSQIQMRYEGAEAVFLRHGRLHIKTSVNQVVEAIPEAYQLMDGRKQAVACTYRVEGGDVSFVFPEGYDPAHPLVIDPVLEFSTFTGSQSDNWGFTATYDESGALYSGGIVNGPGYPATVGAFQAAYGGGTNLQYGLSLWFGCDIALIKYDPTGANRLWATYLGGSLNEQPHSLVVNDQNELFMLGTTRSNNFPTTNGTYDNTFNGEIDIVVSRLSANGANLLGSTYVGGTGADGTNQTQAQGNPLYYFYADDARGEIIIDDLDNVYIAASTSSTNFPVTPGVVQNTMNGVQDACIFKLNANLNTLLWSTYWGGNSYDAGYSLKLDSNFDLYVVGGTASPAQFTTTNGVWHPFYQGGTADGYVLHLRKDGAQVLQSTFVGTNDYDQVYMVDLDKDDNVYFVGQTRGNYPVQNAVYFAPFSGQFITKLDPTLSSVTYSTRFGAGTGAPDMTISAFLVDKCEDVYVSGWGGNGTGSTQGLPTTANAFQSTTDGADFYLCVIEKDALSLKYGTFFGGPVSAEHVDGGTSRFDKNGVVYQSVCAGCGGNSDFPTTGGAWSQVNNATNCNNGAFKFRFDVPDAVYAEFDPVDNGCVPHNINFVNQSVAAVGYEWDFGDGSPMSTSANPSHTYNTPGTYTITLTALNPGKCNQSDVFQRVVEVLAADAGFSASQAEICPGECIDFTMVQPAQTGVTYSWNFPGGTPATASSAGPHTVCWNTSGVRTITLTLSNPYCNDQQAQVITVNPRPQAPTAPDVFRCGNGSVTLTAQMGNPAGQQIQMYDSPTGGATLHTAGSSPYLLSTPQLAASSTFYIEAEALGCVSDRTPVAVTIHPIPAPPTVADLERCGPGFLTFTAQMGNPAGDEVRMYSTPVGGSPLASDHTPPYELPANIAQHTTFYLRAANAAGCESPGTPAAAAVHPIPPTPQVDEIQLCEPAPVTFTANLGQSGNYEVRMAQFAPNCLTSQQLAQDDAAPYELPTGTPVLATRDYSFFTEDLATGCFSPCTSARVVVNPAPADPVIPDLDICAGETAVFTVNMGNPAGTEARLYTTPTSNSHISRDGTAPFTLAVGSLLQDTTLYVQTWLNTCPGNRLPVQVQVSPAPPPPQTTDGSRCGPGGVTFVGWAQGAAALRLYDRITGGNMLDQFPGDSITFAQNLAQTTVFYVEQLDAQGCPSPRTPVSAIINRIPPTPNAAPVARCGPGDLTLTVTGMTSPEVAVALHAQNTCSQTPLAETQPGINTLPYTFQGTGTTTYYLKSTDQVTGCGSVCAPAVVTIRPIPEAPQSQNLTICDGQPAVLSATVTTPGPATVYLYTQPIGGTALNSDVSPGITFDLGNLTTGMHTYYLETEYDDCLSSRSAVEVEVVPRPGPPQTTDTERCAPGAITLSVDMGSPTGDEIRFYDQPTGGNLLYVDQAQPYAYTIPSLAATTTFYVSVRNTGLGCESPRVPATAAIHPLPGMPTPPAAQRCGPGEIQVDIPEPVPAAAQIQVFDSDTGTQVVNVVNGPPFRLRMQVSQTNTYYLEGVDPVTGCRSPRAPWPVSIDAIPPAPDVADLTRCEAGTATFTVSTTWPNATVQRLDAPGGPVVDSRIQPPHTFSVNYATTTTYWFQVADPVTGCSGNPADAVVTIVSPPAVPPSQPPYRCGPGAITLTFSPGDDQVMYLYADQNGAAVDSVQQAPFTFEQDISATTTFYIQVRDTVLGCLSPRQPVEAVMIDPPGEPQPLGAVRCGPGEVTLTVEMGTPPGDEIIVYDAPVSVAPLYASRGPAYLFPVHVNQSVTFYVQAVNGYGCTSPAVPAPVMVSLIPPQPRVLPDARCGPGILTLTASGASTNEVYRMFESTQASNPILETDQATLTTPATNQTRSYYVSILDTVTGCESSRTAVMATIHALPAAPDVQPVSVCTGTQATFSAILNDTLGTTVRMFDTQANLVSERSTAPYAFEVPDPVTVEVAFDFIAVNPATGCESTPARASAQPLPLPPLPKIPDAARCGQGDVFLSADDITQAGHEIAFFAQASGGTPLAVSSQPGFVFVQYITRQTTIYAESRHGTSQCPSPRQPLLLTVHPVPGPPVVDDVHRCGAGSFSFTVRQGVPGGNQVRLYADAQTAQVWAAYPLPPEVHDTPDALATTTYYASIRDTVTGCEGERTPFVGHIHDIGLPQVADVSRCGPGAATITPSMGMPPGDQFRLYDPQQQLIRAINQVGQPVELPEITQTTTFYLSSLVTQWNCESDLVPVVAEVIDLPAAPEVASLPRCGSGPVTFTFTVAEPGIHRVEVYGDMASASVLQTLQAPDYRYTTAALTANRTYGVQTLHPVTGCRSPRVPAEAVVNPLPGPPVVPDVERCGSGGVVITAMMGSPPGQRLRLLNDAQVVIDSTDTAPYTFNYNLGQTATLWMEAVNTQTGCVGPRSPFQATAHTIPGRPTASAQVLCGDNTVNIQAQPGWPSAAQLRLYDPQMNLLATDDSAPYTFQPQVPQDDTYQMTAFDPGTGCESQPFPLPITLLPNPQPPVVEDIPRCGPGRVTLTFNGQAGFAYELYTDPAGGTPLEVVTDTPYSFQTPELTASQVFFVSARDLTTGCISPRTRVTAAVIPLPGPPTGGAVPVCGAGSLTFSAAFGLPAGTELRLYGEVTGGRVYSSDTAAEAILVTPAVSQTTTFYLESHDARTGCTSPRVPVVGEIIPLPPVPAVSSPSRCGAGLLTFTATLPAEADVALLRDAQDRVLARRNAAPFTLATPQITETTTFFVTALNTTTGCESAPVPAVAVIHPVPPAPSVPDPSRCSAGPVTLSFTDDTPHVVRATLYEQVEVPWMQSGRPFRFEIPWLTEDAFYYVSVTSDQNCESPRTLVPVRIYPDLAPPLVAGIERCDTGNTAPVTLSVTMDRPKGTGVRIYSRPVQGIPVAVTDVEPYRPTFDAQVGATSTYYVQSFDGVSGCISPLTPVEITLHATPMAPEAIQPLRCGPGPVSFTLEHGLRQEVRLFDAPSGGRGIAVSADDPAYFSFSNVPSSTVYYAETVDSATGCTSPRTPIRIGIQPIPPRPGPSSNGPVCSGETLVLSVPAAPGMTYTWNGPDGFQATGDLVQIPNAQISDIGLYTVVATNASGCVSEPGLLEPWVHDVTLRQPEPYYYNEYQEEIPLCAGRELNLGIRNYPDFPRLTEFEWKGPNNFHSFPHPFPSIDPPVEVIQAGTYYVRASFNQGLCKTSWVPLQVDIHPRPPIPNLTSNAPLCVGDSALRLQARSAGAVRFNWAGPAGFMKQTVTSRVERPALAEHAGQYRVTAQNTWGCLSDTAFLEVDLLQERFDLLPTFPAAICEYTLLQFRDLDADPATTYHLRGPNGYSYSGPGPVIERRSPTAADAGIYTLSASRNGCTSQPAQFRVDVRPAPPAPVVSGDTSICRGATTRLTANLPGWDQVQMLWTSHGQDDFRGAELTLWPGQYGMDAAYVGQVRAVAQGCTSAAAQVHVDIRNQPEPPIWYEAPEVCPGDSITLQVRPRNGENYFWRDLPDPVETTATTATFTPRQSGTGEVYAVVEGCTSHAARVHYYVKTPPEAPMILGDNEICAGTPLLLAARLQQAAAPPTYLWRRPGSQSWEDADPYFVANATPDIAGIYEAVAVAAGCTSEAAQHTVRVQEVEIQHTFQNGPLCAGDHLRLTAQGTPSATFHWRGPAGFAYDMGPGEITRARIQPDQGGVYSVSASLNGCTTRVQTMHVQVDEYPDLPVVNHPRQGCAGDTVFFSLDDPGYTAIRWYGPSGLLGTGPAVEHVLDAQQPGGTFRVQVDRGACSREASFFVRGTSLQSPRDVRYSGPVCAGETLKLTAVGDGAASLVWDGPGNFHAVGATVSSPRIQESQAGMYRVRQVAEGCTSDAATVAVEVRPAVPQPVITQPGSVCVGEDVALQANMIPGAEYRWTGPDGDVQVGPSSSWTLGRVDATDSGNYTLEVERNGCVSPLATTRLNVADRPQQPRLTSNGPLCAGERLVLSAAGSQGPEYHWSGPQGFTSVTMGANLAFDTADVALGGVYTVRAVAGACSSEAASMQVDIRPGPADLSLQGGGTVCAGETLRMTAQSSTAGVSYIWQGPSRYGAPSYSAYTAEAEIPQAEVVDGGTYSVEARLGNCSRYGTVEVDVLPTPQDPIASNNGPLCVGDDLNLRVNLEPGVSYHWSGPDGFSAVQASPSIQHITHNGAGTYRVAAVQGPCSSRTVQTEVVVRGPGLAFESQTRVWCLGREAVLEGPTASGATYLWMGPPSSGVFDERASVRISEVDYAHAGTYRYWVEDEGCRPLIRQIEVVVDDCARQLDEAGTVSTAAVSVYPNPARSQVWVMLSSPEDGAAELIWRNIQGQQMSRRMIDVSAGRLEISRGVATWPAGVYLLEVRLNGRTTHHRILVQD